MNEKETLSGAIFSAGVGRTGTYIAIDALLNAIKENKEINVFKFVNGLREQRVLMVQALVSIFFYLFSLIL